LGATPARRSTGGEEEELSKIRPDLDGNQIMEILGIEPGPLVGRAYQHMMEVRMDKGPLDAEQAKVELLNWWSTQPESAGPSSME
jgi:poly(A) polymerase